jgi:hypothetical protein
MFAEKNGNGALILYADNEEQAIEEMSEKVKYQFNWRFDGEA